MNKNKNIKSATSAAVAFASAVLFSGQAMALGVSAHDAEMVMKFDGDKGWRANCVTTTEAGRTVSHRGVGRGQRMAAQLVLDNAAYGYCTLNFPNSGTVKVAVAGMDASMCPTKLDAKGICKLTFDAGRARFDFMHTDHAARSGLGVAR